MASCWWLSSPPLESSCLEREHNYIRQDHLAVFPREAQRREEQRFQRHWFSPCCIESQETTKCTSPDASVAWADEKEMLFSLPDIASTALAIAVVQTALARASDGWQTRNVVIAA